MRIPRVSATARAMTVVVEAVPGELLTRTVLVVPGSLPARVPPFWKSFIPNRPPAETFSSGCFPAPEDYNKAMDTARRYLGFDIETASTTKDDWRSQRPLGISCAATLLADSREPILWHGGDRLSQDEAAALVRYLEDQVAQGVTLLTWNGLGFDLDILAEEAQMLPQCRALALAHVDMMFHAFCQLGHGVGLDAAAKGMGLAGKTEGMSGELAPVLWAEGRREEVLRYVAQDVRTTMELARVCEGSGALRWIARSGKVRCMALREGWLTVSDALEMPMPDTSWMDEPWPREKFTGWTEG